MANVDFEFDFADAIAKAYHDNEIDSDITTIAKGLELGTIKPEKAIRDLIKINSSVLAKVLKQYNYELLNEL